MDEMDFDGVARRDVLKYGGTVGVAGFLAGCSTETADDSESTDTDGDSQSQEPENQSEMDPDSETDEESGSYTVEMAPVGEVEFDEPPATVTHYFPDYGDMAVALGKGDTIASMGVISRYHTDHYDELDGVSVDTESMTELYAESGIDREIFLELDSDLNMIDPQWITNNGFFGLDESDVEELRDTQAPFIGNTIFRRTDEWHDYEYYTLYEAFEKVAQVHQETERFEQLKTVHDELIEQVQSELPPESERPNALLTFAAGDQPEAFYPYRVSDKGTNNKQYHDLGISDALDGTGIDGLSTTERGQIDYETMLSVDPDSILVRGHEDKSRAEFVATVLAFMQDDDVASQLTAVQNEQVFRGGPIYPGPLHNLFLTERYANLYFPETFSGELFDRDRVAGIVNGEA
jgi:iron complex transport system substrate-binding protein